MTDVRHLTENFEVPEQARDVTLILDAADLIVTLPKSKGSTEGHKVTVVQRSLSTGTGAQLNPNGTDIIRGQTIAGVAITGAAGKNLINTGATDVLGDRVTLVADGAGRWDMVGLQGVWAIEA